MDTIEVLTRARELIATPSTWWKGWAEHLQGSYCAVRAVNATASRVYECMDAVWALMRALPDWPDGKFKFVHEFNDHPDTTHADVLALYDRAIAREVMFREAARTAEYASEPMVPLGNLASKPEPG